VRLPMTEVGLGGRDVELARRISAAARELGVPADPAAVQAVQLTIDALVGAEGNEVDVATWAGRD
jgi:hypothetical protein